MPRARCPVHVVPCSTVLVEPPLPTHTSCEHPRLTTITKAETSEAAAVGLDEWSKYCEDTSATKRRSSRTVWAGKVPIGSEHRIARQTMTTTNTNDVDATVAQVRIMHHEDLFAPSESCQGVHEKDA